MANQAEIQKAKLLAAKIRRNVIKMIGDKGQTGHLGGSCSSADVVAALYGVKMKHRPDEPGWSGRDKFIYSKGHAAIAQYAAMAEVGYFPAEELLTVKSLGSRLQGHPDRLKTPGIEAGTGSLGQGLSIANGMALAMRLDGHDGQVYCVIGDGELNEGQIWEAAMAAPAHKLNNIVAIIDQNGLQATGQCCERLDIGPLAEKWKAFGWHVIEIDGHDMEAVFAALDDARGYTEGPVAVIAHTVKGKGFAFAEGQAAFHNGALDAQLYSQALATAEAEINALQGETGAKA